MSEWKRGPARRPWLFITTCTPRKVALVKGRDAYQVCKNLSPEDVPPFRSAAGGWVVGLDIVEDIRSYASTIGEWVLVRELKARDREAG